MHGWLIILPSNCSYFEQSLTKNNFQTEMDTMKTAFYIVNALRFIAEVMTLIILITYGLRFAFPLNVLIGLLLPACLLVIWGLFVSPKAKVVLSMLLKCFIEIVIFTAAYLIFHHFSHTQLPILYLCYAIITSICSKIIDRLLESN